MKSKIRLSERKTKLVLIIQSVSMFDEIKGTIKRVKNLNFDDFWGLCGDTENFNVCLQFVFS